MTKPKSSNGEVSWTLRRVTKRLNMLTKQSGGVTTIADAAGVSRQSVYNWLNGRNYPDLASIIRISKLLNVDANWLIGL